MNFGIIKGEPLADYHATAAVSNSKLNEFRRDPEIYFRRYVEKSMPAKKSTSALSIGQAVDTLLLEGMHSYLTRVAVLPANFNGRTNEGKALVASHEAAGKTVIDQAEAALVEEMAKKALAHPDAAALLSVGSAQVSWRHALPEFPIQCRTDWWNEVGVTLPTSGEFTGPYFVELKSARSLNKADFGNFSVDFAKRTYHRQVALYREIIATILAGNFPKPLRCFMIVVDKNEVVKCKVFEPSIRTIELGYKEVVDDLKRLSECYRTGKWIEAPTGIETLELPEWYLKRAERESGIFEEEPAA